MKCKGFIHWRNYISVGIKPFLKIMIYLKTDNEIYVNR